MAYYSNERRAALLKMLLPPLNLSMAEVSRREGVSEMSLYNWRKQVSSKGSAVPENKQLAQNWSAEKKFAVVLEAAGLSEIDLGEYCRLGIPRSSGHLFHEHPATDSTVIRPPIPRTSGHP